MLDFLLEAWRHEVIIIIIIIIIIFKKVYLSSWLGLIKFPNEKQPLIQATSSQIYDSDIIFQFHKHAERPLIGERCPTLSYF